MIKPYNLDYYDVFHTNKYSLEDFDLMWQNLDRDTVIETWNHIKQMDTNKTGSR